MAYTDLTSNERLAYHDKSIELHQMLKVLNQRYRVALTSQERAALRQAAAPVLTDLEATTYAVFQGTIPD